MNIYQENGFANRREYLDDLKRQAGPEDAWKVDVLAEMYGPNEDFDALITHLQDDGVEVSI